MSKRKTFAMCIPEDMLEIIDKICKDLRMSRSMWITYVILEYLKKMGYKNE